MCPIIEVNPTDKVDHIPVVEIFGPTIQGEGRYAGTPCYFLRLGGCDYRCQWCDSMHAVDEKHKDEWSYMSPQDIVWKLRNLPGEYTHLVISGGNPMMHDLRPLLIELTSETTRLWKVSVETQGTIIPPWLWAIDHVTMSPKPPSSGMRQSKVVINRFLDAWSQSLMGGTSLDVKIVVFDQTDIDWAREIIGQAIVPEDTRFFLSVGTRYDDTTVTLLQRYREVIGGVLDNFSGLPQVSILPQMHVLLWGHKKGV